MESMLITTDRLIKSVTVLPMLDNAAIQFIMIVWRRRGAAPQEIYANRNIWSRLVRPMHERI